MIKKNYGENNMSNHTLIDNLTNTTAAYERKTASMITTLASLIIAVAMLLFVLAGCSQPRTAFCMHEAPVLPQWPYG